MSLVLMMIVGIDGRSRPTFSSAAHTQSDSLTFTETGYSVKGRFLAYWQQHGGLIQQGYPISDEFQEKSDLDGKAYTVQYFERAVFEYHPENQPPYDVLLSHLGTLQYRRKYPGGAPNEMPNSDGPRLFRETGKRLGGKFLDYWNRNGGLMQQGYPISDEFQEKSDLDGKTYTVQYFERAVFEYHPENRPPYDVLLSHLGTLQYGRRYSPAAWLREHVLPLRTTEVGGDDADLDALKEIVGNARIVSLGEAAHSAHEFFTMKLRIIQYLVQHMGFRVIAFEDGWAESEEVNKYVQGGTGSGEAALEGLYHYPFPWGTEEVLDLIEWIRSYNQSRGEDPGGGAELTKLRFQGFDMQDASPAINYVLQFLRAADPPVEIPIARQYTCFTSIEVYRQLPLHEKHECIESLRSVYSHLVAHEQEYSARTTAQDFVKALHSARTAVQAGELWLPSNGSGVLELRDRYMAENASWIIEQAGPTAKVIVWAHNQHVQTVPLATAPRVDSMGQHLRRQYGNSMVVIGLDFYGGAINATDAVGQRNGTYTVHEVSTPSEDSYEHYFHSAGIPIFLLNLRDASLGRGVTAWLKGPKRLWSIGEYYPAGDAMTPINLLDAFDAVIFVERISPTRLLK